MGYSDGSRQSDTKIHCVDIAVDNLVGMLDEIFEDLETLEQKEYVNGSGLELGRVDKQPFSQVLYQSGGPRLDKIDEVQCFV